MENINLCEYLKDMPKGIILYSVIHGKVLLSDVVKEGDYPIEISNEYLSLSYFTKDGKYVKGLNGECILFPSKEMRDWTKFFKHGDVIANDNAIAMFDSWVDSAYTEFYAKYLNEDAHIYKDELCNTQDFSKASKERRDNFIKEIESQFKGKLNLESLEIEHEESKSNGSLKPFDKVLVRDYDSEEWQINMFSYYKSGEEYPYSCLKFSWKQCIPYNEEIAYLLGTREDYQCTVDYGKDYSKIETGNK